MIHHPVQSLYIGCYPMGAATLINVGFALLNTDWGWGGKGFLYALWGFWWADVIVSLLCAFPFVHVMYDEETTAAGQGSSPLRVPGVQYDIRRRVDPESSPDPSDSTPRPSSPANEDFDDWNQLGEDIAREEEALAAEDRDEWGLGDAELDAEAVRLLSVRQGAWTSFHLFSDP